MKNKNVNNNIHNIFNDDAEIDAEQEEDAVKMLTNGKCNNKGEEVNKKKKIKSTC